MRRILFVVALLVAGCSVSERPAPPPPPQPLVKIERSESSDCGVVLKISYHNHDTNSNLRCFTVVDNVEKLHNYKKQVEFLLNQLEEAEKRMKVYEQGQPK